MIRVLVVDDQDVVREGLRAMLNVSERVEVVGVAGDGAAALELLPKLKPDLVLMDLKMPVMNGIHATRLINEQYPQIAVLVLTTYDQDDWVFDAIRAGAAGYLLKDSRREDIIAAIEGTVTGRTHIDPGIAKKLLTFVQHGAPPDANIASQLSTRELDVLRLLSNGLSNAVIAERLHLAEGTVRNYVSIIFDKLGVEDRAQATALAWKYGLVGKIE